MRGYLRRFLILLVVVFGIGALAVYAHSHLQQWAVELSEYGGEHPLAAAGVFVVLAVASVVLGPVSSAPLIPPATFLWGSAATFILLLSGWIIGNVSAYLIGRHLGHPVVSRIVGPARLGKWLGKLEPHLGFFMVLLYRLALPAEIGYVFGLIQYPLRKYLLATVLAELPTAALLVWAGDAVRRADWLAVSLALAGWLLLLVLARFMFVRRSKR